MDLSSYKTDYLARQTQFIVLDRNGKVLDSCDSLFRASLQQESLFESLPLLESLREVLAELAPEDGTLNFPCIEGPLFGLDGVFDMAFELIRWENEWNYLWLITDFTDHYRNLQVFQQERNERTMQKELLETQNRAIFLEKKLLHFQNEELKQRRDFQMEFFSKVGHEIRTPVNGIIGLAQLLQTEVRSEEARDYLNALGSAARHMSALVNDLLDIGKIESGKIVFERAPFSLRSLLKSLLTNFRLSADEKGIWLKEDIQPEVPDWIVGDQLRFSQILYNLLGNAIKFTDKGGIWLRILSTGKQEARERLKIEVEDSGIGIAKEKLTAIFDPFSQGAEDTTRKYGGTGLGLSIVRQLVELQGGRIQVESELGMGSVFSVELEFEVTDERPVEEQEAEVHEKDGRSILIVEDNPFNQKVVAGLLKKAGFETSTAGNGQEALALLQNKHTDLIIMDLQMPVMDGYETIRQIRCHAEEAVRQLPVIAMSGTFMESEESVLKQQGFNTMLQKPLSPRTMLLQVQKHLKQQVLAINVGSDQFVLDLEYLEEVSGEDSTFLLELVDVFLEEAGPSLEKLNQAYQAGNNEALSREAHRFKSNFRYLGIQPLFQALEDIELKARTVSGTREFQASLEDFSGKCHEAVQKLTGIRAQLIKKTDQNG